MKTALAVTVMTIACLLAVDCYAQSTSSFQSVGGDYGRNVLTSLNDSASQSNATSGNSSLWTWGNAPKGSILSNGKLITDPFNTWKSLNLTDSGMAPVGLDPYKGYPIYAYKIPNTGEIRYFYIDPLSGEPFYLDEGNAFVTSDTVRSGSYALPPVFS